ncbi:hypothetical protein H8356DRAFT_1273289 [Neocallimastix lanati (nom. inval.)]|uniref:Scaffoldin n=1 Tax=Neocallimastix californiae TaxID=1754190 RepID=A0A1Y2BSX3_9FUNG|nr:hypothetical protein H8356DRAFT_1273289 [Neocallimastix sp. JGI-2020a]ORY37849.1 hypothetical protein LY90DRAFT_511078 [Neocallimastix californiae]|eukprot:ORY37849.1 hypothetical protein LY90DRAFT_511078 [Neocallimastix californiae]
MCINDNNSTNSDCSFDDGEEHYKYICLDKNVGCTIIIVKNENYIENNTSSIEDSATKIPKYSYPINKNTQICTNDANTNIKNYCLIDNSIYALDSENKVYCILDLENKEYNNISIDVEDGDYLINNKLYLFSKSGNTKKSIRKRTINDIIAIIKVNEYYSKKINKDEFQKEFLEKNVAKILIYHCKLGNCNATTGNILYDKDKILYCMDSYGCSVSNKNNCTYSGTVIYDNEYKLCSDKSSYYSVSSSSYYIIGNDLYLLNQNKNIIGISSQDGYFINNDNKLVECKMSYIISITCIQSIYTSDGYYQNLSSTATNSLIYCKNKKCKVIEVDNRLYWNNSNNEIIRCSAQFCNTYKLGQSCNDHPNEIISL